MSMSPLSITALTTVAIMLTAVVNSQGGPRPLKPVAEGDIQKITDAMPSPVVSQDAGSRPRILVFYLCDGFYHKSIPVANKFIEIMGQKTGAFDTEVSKDMSVFTTEKLAEFDAIVFNNTTRLKFEDQDQRKALMAFAKSGKGIIGIHAASDNFANFPEAAEMMGGLFDGHPWSARGTWSVKIDDPTHPINKAFGGKNFKISDEIYQIKAPYSRDTHRVLLTLDLEDPATAAAAAKGKRKDKDFAISWIKRCGEGRVFYCSLGHNNSVFFNKDVAQHYLDGIQYALGVTKVDDTPSAKAK